MTVPFGAPSVAPAPAALALSCEKRTACYSAVLYLKMSYDDVTYSYDGVTYSYDDVTQGMCTGYI